MRAWTDVCGPSFGQKKAYTAAIRRMDSVDFAEWLRTRNMTIESIGDPNLITLQGGLVVVNPSDGIILGGIGVGGLPTGKEDEDIARAGLAALNL